MTSSILDTFLGVVEVFPLIGLTFDMLGAILVLGPELPGLAQSATMWERFLLKRLLNRITNHEVVTSESKGFTHLQIAVKEGHIKGEEKTPFTEEEDLGMEFFGNFDEIERLEDMVEIRSEDGNRKARFRLTDLQTWISTYSGIERDYFKAGGLLLVTGFFFQIVAEVVAISPSMGLLVFFIGSSLLLYYIYLSW